MNSKRDIEKKKINVAVLGATGVVGQVFIHLLAHHQLFELSMINGSVSRNGKTYGDEVQWVLPVPIPETVENMKLEALHVDMLKNREIKMDHEFFPQSKMSFWGFPSGMQVFTGRLRKGGDKIGFTLLVNNLVKGAAGGSVANAELFIHTYEQFLK